MSIICYTGLPGDGKSYSAVENVVIPALKEGRHVAHNLQLNEAALRVVTERDCGPLLHQIGKDDTPADLIAKCPPGAVIVIDEIARYWPGGIKANEVPKEELRFFKEHRHRVGDDGLATEILIIDQDPQTGIPAFLRALIELTYVHTKQSAVGASGRFRVDVYVRAQSAEKPKKGALIRKLMGTYKPEVWNCYISHTQSKRPGEAGLEKAVDQRASLLKSWPVQAAIIATILLPVAFWWAFDSMDGIAADDRTTPIADASRDGIAHAQRSEHAQPAAASQPAAPGEIRPTPRAAPKPKQAAPDDGMSQVWRLLGVIAKADGKGYALLTSSTGRRFLDVSKCTQDKDANWLCLVEDGKASMWSGARDSVLAAAAPEGMRGQH